MSPPPPNPPSECARCHRPLRAPSPAHGPITPRQRGIVVAIRFWPEGPVCSGCYAKACETYGRCPGCGRHRLLPGLDTTKQPICTDCAGNIGNFTCTRCGQEGWNQLRGLCGRCVLHDRLTIALDDGTGTVNTDLLPLMHHLTAMPRPRTGLLWLTKPHTLRLLAALARRQVPLTHDGLATLTPYKAVAHLRQLLIATQILPDVDKTLLRIEQWTTQWLTGIAHPDHRRTLEQYARWHLHRRLRAAAAHSRLNPYRDQSTRYYLRQAHDFLTWLDHQRKTLAALTQHTLDKWVATAPPPQRSPISMFLRWAIRAGRAPRLRLPPQPKLEGQPLTQQERLAWLRRVLNDESINDVERVAVAILLLYAQPLSRIARLTTHDISHDPHGRMLIHLGTPPAPVPAPFDQILQTYITRRQPTAANHDSDWLFPGRHGGLPIHPTSLRLRLHTLGLQTRAARARALRELVTQAPPAVIASMLGYQPATTEHTARAAGSTWTRYASLRAAQN